MNKRITIAIILLALYSCSSNIEQDIIIQEEQEQKEEYSPYVPGEFNVYFSAEAADALETNLGNDALPITKSAELASAIKLANIVSIERLFPHAGRFEARTRAEGLHRWYRIKCDNKITATKAENAILDIPSVEKCERVLKAKPMGEPFFNDPLFPKQWHYINDGSGSNWKAGADINVLPVWQKYSTGSPEVIVCVVDGGIDLAHEDLSSQVLIGSSKNFVSGGSITAHSHGTHVAGTIAAANNNGIGVSGIAGGDYKAGNPGTRLISAQVFETTAKETKSGGFEDAIKWGADHGAVICNNSWGYDFNKEDGSFDGETAKKMHDFFLQPNKGEYSDALKDAIDYFNKYAGMDEFGQQEGPMAGGLVLFSAGNDARTYGAPAGYEGVLAVGAIGPHGGRAYYSSYGEWVDIAAPGGDANYSYVISTLPGNEYGNMQGTSMACPHVSGVAALVVASCGGPGFTREMLIERLTKGTSSIINTAPLNIGPLVDALGAVTYGTVEIPKSVSNLSGTVKSNTVNLKWTVTDSDNGIPAYAYLILYGKDENAVINAVPNNPGSGVKKLTVYTEDATAGASLSALLNNLDFDTDYFIKIYGYDYNLNYSESSAVLSVKTEKNNPPIIKINSSEESIILHSFEKKDILVSVSEPDMHSFSISFENGSGADSWMSVPGGAYQITIKGSGADSGTYTCTFTATDEYGLSSSCSITYTILENQAPVNTTAIDNILLYTIGEVYNLDMGNYFMDPDTEKLNFEFSYDNPAVVHANAEGDKLYLTTLKYGLTTITVKAYDAKKEYAEASFKVLVRSSDTKYQTYPNPVVNTLFIATGEETEDTNIVIASSSGKTVYNQTVKVSAFNPAAIDMSHCAPGQYVAVIDFGGNVYNKTFIKQ